MGTPDNSIIENQAIAVLKQALYPCGKLKPNILDNDKTTSWDGSVEVHSGSPFSKKTLSGIVNVQVKGKWKQSIEKEDEIKYSVDIEDLKNYQHTGGTIFFVVHCNYEGGMVYYNSMLPLDIERVLSDIEEGKKTKSLKFDRVPIEKPLEVLGIFSDFLYHSEKQRQQDKEIARLFREKKLDLKNRRLSFGYGGLPTTGESDVINYMLSHPTYMYLKPDDIDISIPLSKIYLDEIEEHVETPFIVNDEILYDKVVVVHSKDDKKTMKLGKNITIFPDDNKMDISLSDDLRERITDLKYLRYIFASEGGEAKLTLDDGDAMGIEEVEEQLDFFGSVLLMFQKYGVGKSLNVATFTEDDWKKLDAVVRATLHNEAVPYSFGNKPGIGILRLGNINLLICCVQSADNDKLFYIKDAFTVINDQGVKFGYKFGKGKDEESYMMSPYFEILNQERLEIIDNLDFKLIKQSLFECENDEVCHDQILNFCIVAIKAYDVVRRKELLIFVNDILEELSMRTRDDFVKACCFINQMQIALRQETKLDSEQIRMIYAYKAEFIQNKLFVGCCNILLNNFVELQILYDDMSKSEKETFDSFPITIFWER